MLFHSSRYRALLHQSAQAGAWVGLVTFQFYYQGVVVLLKLLQSFGHQRQVQCGCVMERQLHYLRISSLTTFMMQARLIGSLFSSLTSSTMGAFEVYTWNTCATVTADDFIVLPSTWGIVSKKFLIIFTAARYSSQKMCNSRLPSKCHRRRHGK